MSVLRAITIITAVAGSMTLGLSAVQAAPATSPADMARPLSSAEIYRIYSHKSWMWKDGAGYFAVPKREFKAWSGKGSKATLGHGMWFITEPGKLCLRATWQEKSGIFPVLTCFSHREKDGVIYQRREPDGEWYAFKNAPVRKGDEFTKLRRGDYVSRRFNRMAEAMASN